jgi:uncharacterized protein (TIGR02001 family)
MKKQASLGIMAAALFAVVIATSMPAKAMPKIAEVNVDYVTSYIWRGIDSHPQNDPAIQPGIDLSLPQGWGLNIWASYGFDEGLNSNLDELDFTLSKSGEFTPAIVWTAGHTYYTFPTVDKASGAPAESNESFAGLSFPKLPLQPAVNLYVDWETGNGVYGSVSGSYELPFGISKSDPKMSLGINIGYSDGQWGTRPGLADISTSLSIPIKIHGIILSPSLNYSIAPDERVNADDELWLGLNFKFQTK